LPAQWAMGNGWFELVYDLSTKLSLIPGIEISSIKEKHGELRVETRGSNALADQFMFEAEERSATICEVCGRPGSTIQTGVRLKTLCVEHEKRYDNTDL